MAGPWANVKDVINYALEINPKICFPVHDGMLISPGANHRIPALILEKSNIIFKVLENKEEEF